MQGDERTPDGHKVRVFGEYQLIEHIGRGPRSEVWRARQGANEDIAVKLFHPQLADRPDFVTVFEKETAALTVLSHPNILRVSHRAKVGSRYALVSEWIREGSLRRAGKMPVGKAINVAIAICDALDYTHRRGLLHRNLVLDNVFVDGSGKVIVSDFSLSLLHGTAPQERVRYDARADVSAVASLLYELIAGTPPAARFVPLSNLMEAVPARLDQIFTQALSPDSAERFGRATELALSLRLAMPTSTAPAVAEEDAFAVSVDGPVVTVAIASSATGLTARPQVDRLGTMLSQRGPWRLMYDLGAIQSLDSGLSSALQRLHLRCQRNLERVAFYSPRALVRSEALVLGSSVKRLPWKMFSAREPMRKWIEERS